MAATKIILKRSSILGKRPNSTVIEAGELALNTNAAEPGLFFEVDTGDVIKVGPAAVGAAPVTSPEKGEFWFDTVQGDLKIGTIDEAKKVWRSIASPYLGGGGRVVFVAPEFPFSSDSLANNGETLPYQSINRAILEISKKYVQDVSSGLGTTEDTGGYTIYYASSRVTAYNAPGSLIEDFTVKFDEEYYSPTYSELTKFNTPQGDIILPNGTTIQAMDYKKCEISPAYVPSYRHPAYAATDVNINQPLSSIFKISGNSYLNSFTVIDKIGTRRIYRVSQKADTNIAVFHSVKPHGLNTNDLVFVNYASGESDLNRTFQVGDYYAVVYDQFTFSLTETSFQELIPDNLYVTYTSLIYPGSTQLLNLIVTNQLKSAHRLSVFSQASKQEIAEYYEKVQHAFAEYFGGRVIPGLDLVDANDYIVVAPTENNFPNNLSTNSTNNSSAYVEQITLRSSYGMCGGNVDGRQFEGFESIILNACTVVSLQTDPAAYEVYASLYDPTTQTSQMKWWTLAEATYLTLPTNQRPERIENLTVKQQLDYLNSTRVENIRYYYKHLTDSDGKSFGLTDIDNDFRHYGFRAMNGAYVQAQSIYTIGCAIGTWALNGGYIDLTNSTSNFGSIAFQSEGFTGINTIGGAFQNGKNFLLEGIHLPLALTRGQVEDNENKRILSLGGRISKIEYDPNDPNVQLVYLTGEFLPCFILPYSLKPGSAVWVASQSCLYRGFLASDGGYTVKLNDQGNCVYAVLRIRSSDSTIPSDSDIVATLGVPFIRRFVDPRDKNDRTYSFVVSNTSPTSVAPSINSVLRLNQETQGLGMSTYIPNVQLDPGSLGGWGRVFSVSDVSTVNLGLSPNFNYVVNDITQASKYIVTLNAADLAKPWTQVENFPQGSYSTFANRNWYAAENNFWDYLYYDTPFSSTIGPEKLAPGEMCSPYVVTSTLERQDLVKDTFQGSFAADPEADEYPNQTYFRGSTNPYTEYALQDYYDDDDSSEGFGICLKDVPTVGVTAIVTPINEQSVVQPERMRSATHLYRPAVVRFQVISSSKIQNPKQSVSVVRITNPTQPGVVEYLRVIGLIGTTLEAIRLNRNNGLYPTPKNSSGQDFVPSWPAGSIVTVCATNSSPSPMAYDPDWSMTKNSMLRFFEVMGYQLQAMSTLLQPRFWGERIVPLSETFPPMAPTGGYAKQTTAWPVEFNQPSTIIANNHTWSYCGYPLYSQGLPKYRTSKIPRKLGFDFLCSTLWGGNLTVQGTNDAGELVLFGPQREALTSQFYQQAPPTLNTASQQLYEQPPLVEFPSQVVVYSLDNISEQFNGQNTTFELTLNGFDVPPGQLSQNSLFVQLGAITQNPGVNYLLGSGTITFTSAPLAGSNCDIRVVTSEDSEKTLKVVRLYIDPPDPENPSVIFDGVTSVFTLKSEDDISNLIIDGKNTFVILGGVEQLPNEAYLLSRISPTELELAFTGAPLEGSTIDIRAICTNSYWASRGVFPVSVYSMDPIGPIDGVQTSFELTYQNQAVNPQLVTTENLMVSLGGAMQIPNTAYTVESGRIVFTEPPKVGTHTNLRVITNSEFISCVDGQNTLQEFITWGPSIISGILSEIATIKSQLG